MQTKTNNRNERWPYYPNRLTDILDSETLRLLLAGAAKTLDFPVALWEREVGSSKPVAANPHQKDRNYPPFCRSLWDEEFRKAQNFSGPLCDALSALGTRCTEDQIERAQDQLNAEVLEHSTCRYCHLGLSTLYAPIDLIGRTVGVVVTGTFIESDRKETVIEGIERWCQETWEGSYLLDRAKELPVLDSGQLNKFRKRFEEEVATLKEVAEKYYFFKLASHQWDFRARINTRVNEILLEPGNTLKKKASALLVDIKDFFGVSFVALFCSEKPYDSVLPLFCQIGHDQAEVESVYFNWKDARLSPGPGFNSIKWLYKNIGDVSYPKAQISSGLKGPGAKRFSRTTFFLPYVQGNQYLGAFLLGPFKGASIQYHRNFLSYVGHVILSRVLATVALEELSAGGDALRWKTHFWVHDMRRELHQLNGEIFMVKDILKAEGSPFAETETDRLRVSFDRMKENMETLRNLVSSTADANRETKEDITWADITSSRIGFHLLSTLIRNCAERFRPDAGRRDLRIEIDPSLDFIPGVEIDLGQMRLVFQNLLQNAVKYSTRETTIRIYGKSFDHEETKRTWVKLCVENIGIGIPAEDGEEIFKPFYRSDRAKKIPGEGLGLAHCREVISQHGGNIWVDSEVLSSDQPAGSDHRTIFYISLPTKSVQGGVGYGCT